MLINEIEIENYKCFKRRVTLKLDKGVNVIVGKNNVGKTALLEVLSLQFPDRPHYSIETFPKRDQKPYTHSKATLTFTLELDEVKQLLVKARGRGDVNFRLPLNRDFKLSKKENDARSEKFQNAAGATQGQKFFSNDRFTFKLLREAISDTSGNWRIPDASYISPALDRVEENDGNTQEYIEFGIEPEDRTLEFKKATKISGGGKKHREDFTGRLIYEICESAKNFGQYIYIFRAERVALSSCSLRENRKLGSDSANLAEVLHYHLSNTTQAKRLNKLLRQIIPNIYQVAAPSSSGPDGAQAEIVVWNTQKAVGYNHLCLPLKDVGSGVSQVLAILYIILTAEDPQILLIDEPQSFLHPDACRKLIEVLRIHGGNHQIIISTHSPTIVTSAEPKTVALVKQKGSESSIKGIDIEKVDNLRAYLGEIGAKLSDVFGYDRVVWVEGITEEICFPKILRVVKGKPLLGTAILGVHSVGEFRQVNNKEINRVLHIYKKLSSGDGGLVPEAVGFIFDRDDYSDEQIDNWKEDSCELYFTNRRNLESYLIHPDAISHVIGRLDGQPIKPYEIEKWIDENRLREKYYTPLPVPSDLTTWQSVIHGKRFLEELFEGFCSTLYSQNFKEKVHSRMLVEWLLKNKPNELAEIADLIDEAMRSKKVRS